MKFNKWFSERIEKRRLKLAVIFAAATLVVYQGYLHLMTFMPEQVYLRQFAGVGACILGVISVVEFYKMFKGGLAHTVAEYLGKAFKKLTGLAQLAAARIRKALGLPDRRTHRRDRANDERSFFFDERRSGRKKSTDAEITKRKWKDLKSDTERLRFMFVRLVKKYTKKGKKYSVFYTPIENGASWSLSADEGGGFFDSYTEARYGDGSYVLDPDKMRKYTEITGLTKSK